MAELRLCLARAEARRHSPREALKHLHVAENVLGSSPNPWLQGVLWLDRSNVEGLLGDFGRSLESANVAIRFADDSGHHRTRVAAAINASHLYSWMGDFERAEENIAYAMQSCGTNIHLRRAALDSLANLLISSKQYPECKRLLAADERTPQVGIRLHWDALTELYTSARLAQAEKRWQDAHVSLTKGLQLSVECGDRLSEKRMRIARARCLAMMGHYSECGVEVGAVDWQSSDLEEMAGLYGALAAAERFQPDRVRLHLGRALRLSDSMLNAALRHDLLTGMTELTSADASSEAAPPDLDSAVALLELGGHPHVMAREAVAIIDGAGCAAAVALVAIGPDGPRVIDTRGWTDQQAAAIARSPGTRDVLSLGPHRDEPWQIIVEPKPELQHRCTFMAIRRLVHTAVTLDRYRRDEKQRAALWPAESLDGDPESIWVSEQMVEVLHTARRIAPSPLSILLTGETGTGKEMLAQTIHRASGRADRTFLPFNCSAVPRDMLESQLFGYRKGAFTGADAPFPGVIRAATGGTLFLDEIADVHLDLQPKLLRFLETHEIHPLGEPQPIKVDVRVIAATNANLDQLVAAGRFREDLFYRLNVVQLKLPPLRERREEIPALIDHYLRRHGDELKKNPLTLADETLEYLLLYAWPGNVRQLANEVRRMVALAEPASTLAPALLSPEILATRRTVPAAPATEPEVRVRIDQPLPVAVEMLEQTMVRDALTRAHGRVEEAAKLLGISRKGLFLKRRRWGIQHAGPASSGARQSARPSLVR